MPPVEWDRRQLCPDGGCIGVIGPDGTCKVCGHAAPNWGDERNRGLTPVPPDSPIDEDVAGADDHDEDGDGDGHDADHDDDDAADDDEPDVDALPTVAASGDAWDDRRLCSDDGCIGVIGDNGRCNTCGKPAAKPVAAKVAAAKSRAKSDADADSNEGADSEAESESKASADSAAALDPKSTDPKATDPKATESKSTDATAADATADAKATTPEPVAKPTDAAS